MKKLLFLSMFATVLFFSARLNAQQQAPADKQNDGVSSHDAKKRVVPIIKVGFTRSNVYDREGEEFVSDGKTGFMAGAGLALPLGSLLGIQPEITVLQKGFEGAGRILGSQYMIDRTTTNVDIPVQLQFKPFSWLTFVGGPQWSFVLHTTDRYSIDNGTAQREIENNDMRNSLFGTLIGADVNFAHVVLGFRSGWDVAKTYNNSSAGSPQYRNRWIIWSLGYRFY
jgi:hypothetical protein